jgi:hypothetical protein
MAIYPEVLKFLAIIKSEIKIENLPLTVKVVDSEIRNVVMK